MFQVFDENRFTRDDFLGMVELTLINLPKEQDGRQIAPKIYQLRPRRSVRLVLRFSHGETICSNREPIINLFKYNFLNYFLQFYCFVLFSLSSCRYSFFKFLCIYFVCLGFCVGMGRLKKFQRI